MGFFRSQNAWRNEKIRAKKVPIIHKGKEYILDSKTEFDRYKILRLLEEAGSIRNLEIHQIHKLDLFPDDPAIKKRWMKADFDYEEYRDTPDGREWYPVTEDVKGGIYDRASEYRHNLFEDIYKRPVRIMYRRFPGKPFQLYERKRRQKKIKVPRLPMTQAMKDAVIEKTDRLLSESQINNMSNQELEDFIQLEFKRLFPEEAKKAQEKWEKRKAVRDAKKLGK